MKKLFAFGSLGTGDIPALYSNFAIVTRDDLLLGKK